MSDSLSLVTDICDLPLVKDHPSLAQVFHRRHIMAYQQHCPSFFGHISHLAHTFFLEGDITYGKHLVHQQNFRL